MPYGMKNDEQEKKMEQCVMELRNEGEDKESAIRICKESILQEEAVKEHGKEKT
ncbi:MAG: hypothetical protein K9L56_14230 [Clostridiales bacterium]|nr:hypothetical protein [Clostridiales bacterium]